MPFNTNDDEESLAAKRLLLEIFSRLIENGFRFYVTANLTGFAVDCIFFSREENYEVIRLLSIV